MEPVRTFAAAAGVVLALGGVGAPVASAIEPLVAPVGYQRLVDDSGRLSIDVPAAWSDVVTQSAAVDGADVPAIAATTPGSEFPNSFLAPGALYLSLAFASDADSLAGVFAPEGCQGPAIEPFQNGVLVGVVHRYTACGPTGAEQHIVAASPLDHAFTAVLLLHVAAPVDPSIAPTVLASLNSAGATPPPVSTTPPVTAQPVPTPQPVPTAPPVTAPPVPTAPPVTAAPPTGPDSNGVTITNAGDPAARATLLVPFVVGQRGNSENFSTLSGTLTASGAQSWTTSWQESAHDVGVDEVLAVNGDGSIQLRYTPSSIEYSESYSNPDISGSGYDPTVLEGIPLLISYGPDRASTSVAAAPGVSVSANQQAMIDELAYTMPGAGLPTVPVGVGATWTAPLSFSLNGIDVTGTTTYQLVAVDGDQYNVTSSVTIDLSTADPAGYPDDITSASGTITLTNLITGSLSGAMQYRQTGTVRTLATLTYSDGTIITVDSTGDDSFEETPA